METSAWSKVQILIIALVLTVAIPFVPFGSFAIAPLILFVTFIHEIFHLIAGLATGGSVRSLSVFPDGSGLVVYQPTSDLGSAITSSAGYMGTVLFGALLMVLLRRGFAGARLLTVMGWIFVFSTAIFGFLVPLINLVWLPISFLSILFTTGVGVSMGVALILGGKFLSRPFAEFTLAFLAIQCILNGFGDIIVLFDLHSGANAFDNHSDAMNMEQMTGIPAIIWSVKWMAISLVLVILAVASYAKPKR